jgi:uncharacterized protein (TIGR02118 family)
MPAMQRAIVLAPRSARYSRTEFQRHYEAFHAPLFYSFGKVGVGRYVRNHIVRVIGADPHFDTISEFGNYPDKRAELIAALRSPEAKALEEDVQTFLAERGNVFDVSEELISGPPRSFEPGPVGKRLVLVKRPVGTSAGDFAAIVRDYAENAARKLGTDTSRITLTSWKQDPTPPMDAMVAIWPAAGAILPDAIGDETGVEIYYTLDVESYCTAWCD